MKLYDNDAYRDEFMEGVYSLLNDDPTWNRANAIIDLFDGEDHTIRPPVRCVQIRRRMFRFHSWTEWPNLSSVCRGRAGKLD